MRTEIRSRKSVGGTMMVVALVGALCLCPSCGTLDRGYNKQVSWTNAPVVQVFTNTVVVTNFVPQVIERTNLVLVTNAATGAVSGYAAREPVATNVVTMLLTNFVHV